MRLGLREIRRASVRFGLLVGAVGLLVFLILFQQTLLTNLLGFFTGALEHQSGRVVVYGADARQNLAGSVIAPGQLEAVARVPGVAEVGPLGEGTFTTRAANGEEVDGILFGYRLGGPGEPTRLSAGRLPEGPNEGVASAIDRDNGFDLGDEVTILPGTGGTDPLRIRVVGLADDSRFSVQPVLFVSYPTYEAARRVANPSATGPILPSAVLVQPEPGVTPEALARRINRQVPDVDALERGAAVEAAPGVAPVRQSFSIILVLTFLVVTLVTGFFFLILTVQKQAALTLLRAVGASPGYLVRSVIVQVVVVVAGGLLVGVGLLALASTRSSATFPIQVDVANVVTSALAVVVLALLASLVALRRVARLEPADAVSNAPLGGLT